MEVKLLSPVSLMKKWRLFTLTVNTSFSLLSIACKFVKKIYISKGVLKGVSSFVINSMIDLEIDLKIDWLTFVECPELEKLIIEDENCQNIEKFVLDGNNGSLEEFICGNKVFSACTKLIFYGISFYQSLMVHSFIHSLGLSNLKSVSFGADCCTVQSVVQIEGNIIHYFSTFFIL